MSPLESLVLAAGVAWMTGTVVTWIRIRQISTDTPGGAFLIALVAWPFFWLG